MSERAPGTYGDDHAEVYDRIYGARFAPDDAVDALATAAGPGGRVLELGVGTGRLAIPLVRRGVAVDGIEASGAMISRLRAHPDAPAVGIFQVDLADFSLPRRDYDVAVCAVSTLFMLDHAAQRSCLAATARHVRPGGRVFVEAFRPDPRRFDAEGLRHEQRPDPTGSHQVRSRHDAGGRCISVTHELSDPGGTSSYGVTLHYRTPTELDAVAREAGLALRARWHDWSGAPDDGSSADPVSVYTPIGEAQVPTV